VVEIAAYEMWDSLSVITADYTAADLNIKSQNVISETVVKYQDVREGDDNSEERASYSNSSIWAVKLNLPLKSESDIGTYLSYYNDAAKANGIVRTFYWVHPTDSHIYTVRFNKDLTRTITMGNFFGIPNVELRVLGRKP